MLNLLITGFDPFGNETVNPSFEAVKLLPDNINGVNIIKKEIPTKYFTSKDVLLSLIEEYNPFAVINVGQAGGRKGITIERYAYNLMDAKIPDNAGVILNNEVISNDGKELLESTLPFFDIVTLLNDKGIDCALSNDPGRFICNYVMFSMLELNSKYNFISGFIHVPYSHEQVLTKDENTPYMEVKDIEKALEILLELLIKKRDL